MTAPDSPQGPLDTRRFGVGLLARAAHEIPWRALAYLVAGGALVTSLFALVPVWEVLIAYVAESRTRQALLAAALTAGVLVGWLHARFWRRHPDAAQLFGPSVAAVASLDAQRHTRCPDTTQVRIAAHVVINYVLGGSTSVVATARSGSSTTAEARSKAPGASDADVEWGRLVTGLADTLATSALGVRDRDPSTDSITAALHEAVSIVERGQRPAGYVGALRVPDLLAAGRDYAHLLVDEHADRIWTVAIALVERDGCLTAEELSSMLPPRAVR